LLIFIAVFVYCVHIIDDYEPTDLKASAKYAGGYFQIVNHDDFDWSEVRIEVNGTYSARVQQITAGQAHYLKAAEFSKDDGTRLNPVLIKVRKILIKAKTPGGSEYWSGEWNN